jgi:Uma2 family endonuclease
MTTAVQSKLPSLSQRMTMREFQALPEGPPFFEFERGELIPMVSPTSRHQDLLFVLTRVLKDFTLQHRLGRVFLDVDVYLPDDEHGYIPDITFLSAANAHLHHEAGDQKIHGAPDLVVELVSADTHRDRVEKFRAYYDNGVTWYWMVDSKDLTIEEHQWTPQGYLRTATVAAGEDFRPRLFDGLVINLSTLLKADRPPADPKSEAT